MNDPRSQKCDPRGRLKQLGLLREDSLKCSSDLQRVDTKKEESNSFTLVFEK